MVYCDYIKHDNTSVTYAYGGTVEDLSGELKFHFIKDAVEVVKKPETEDAPMRHIMRLYGKHKANFVNGIFEDKISYES